MRPAPRAHRHQAFGRRAGGDAGDPLASAFRGPPRTRAGAYLRYALMRAKVRLAYRGDFLFNAAGDLLVAGIGVVFLWAIFRNVPDIRGWTFHEVLFIWGLGETAAGLFFVLFQGLWALNQQYILRGELDRVLLRPLDPYAQIMLDHLNLEDLPVALLGLSLVAWAMPGLPAFSVAQWLMLPVFIAAGVLVLAGVLTAFSSLGFRLLHRGTAVGLVYQASAFNRYPIEIFSQPVQRLLTWVVPFAFIAYFPATWYLGRTQWLWWALAQPLVGVGLFTLGRWLWGRGLRHYRSPGS
ncbi:ABC-2 family transporter protein [Myxococcota bacterium]|nr:ABC-2 family transporter protein [Myxococcota bacterium]